MPSSGYVGIRNDGFFPCLVLRAYNNALLLSPLFSPLFPLLSFDFKVAL